MQVALASMRQALTRVLQVCPGRGATKDSQWQARLHSMPYERFETADATVVNESSDSTRAFMPEASPVNTNGEPIRRMRSRRTTMPDATQSLNLVQGRHFQLDTTYDSASFRSTIFALNGSVIPQALSYVILWAIYDCLLYLLKLHLNRGFAQSGRVFITSFITVFLVFRLKGAHGRYCTGLKIVAGLTDHVRTVIHIAITYTNVREIASTREEIEDLIRLRKDIIRFSIVSVVLTKLASRVAHCHSRSVQEQTATCIKLDMARCRGLLSESEFGNLDKWLGTSSVQVQGRCCSGHKLEMDSFSAISLPCWAIHHLRNCIAKACFGPSQYALPPRMIATLEKSLASMQQAATFIFMAGQIPVPLSYSQMGKLLLLLFNFTFPLEVHPDHGVFANIIMPLLMALMFHGIDCIASELDDPYGDDHCDVKLVTPLHQVEAELFFLLANFRDPTLQEFTWRDVPEDDQWLWPRRVTEYLCLASEMAAAGDLEGQARKAERH